MRMRAPRLLRGDSLSAVDPADRAVPGHQLTIVDLTAVALDFLHHPIQIDEAQGGVVLIQPVLAPEVVMGLSGDEPVLRRPRQELGEVPLLPRHGVVAGL